MFYALISIMKLLLIVSLAILAAAHAEENTKLEPDYAWFPDGDGVPHLLDLNEKYVEESPEEIQRNKKPQQCPSFIHLWNYDYKQNAGAGSGIHPNDANNVQVIHTNAGSLGLQRAAGDSDFYPNGGKSQPGCGRDLTGACAHSRAYRFFAESIRNPRGFRATGVSNVFMGGETLTTARGSFQLNTAADPPFALG